MKITKNTTKYDTRIMSQIIKAVYAWMRKDIGKPIYNWPSMVVDIRYTKGGVQLSGCASLRGWHMTLRLPRPVILPPESTTRPEGDRELHRCKVTDFAWLVWHELLHSYGYNHHQFTPQAMHGTDSAERFHFLAMQFMERLPDAVKAPKVKPDREQVVRARLEAIAAAKKRWTTKAKRASTALKKLNAQERRWGKELAKAAGKSKVEPIGQDWIGSMDQ